MAPTKKGTQPSSTETHHRTQVLLSMALAQGAEAVATEDPQWELEEEVGAVPEEKEHERQQQQQLGRPWWGQGIDHL